MCAICDKVDFIIDSIEKLVTPEEWKETVIKSLSSQMPPEMLKNFNFSEQSCKLNLIARIAAVWSDRTGIPPGPMLAAIQALMYERMMGGHEDEGEDEETPEDEEIPAEALRRKLKDYES